MSPRFAPLALLCLVLLAIAGCSDSSEPAAAGGDGSGTIDPGAGTYVLKSLQCPLPDGGYCRVELVGTDLVLDDDGEHVDLTVAVRNAGGAVLHGPLTVWVMDFEPTTTWPVNGDVPIMAAAELVAPAPGIAGYIYDGELGEDRVLDPGETTGGRLWRFRTEDQGSFSFAMRVNSSEPPAEAAISGVCFWDEDRDGVRDDGEWPMPGFIRVTAPDNTVTTLHTDRSGNYFYPLHTTGLYELFFDPMIDTVAKTGEDRFAPIAYSTPNPRHVLIVPGPDGNPRGFHDADFGAYTDLPPPVPPIRFTDAPVDSLHREPWHMYEIALVENYLGFGVSFSGCQPEHDFSLWMSGGIMESMPPQVNIVLVHETAEECDAAFSGEYLFDLRPLADLVRQAYGPSTLILNVYDYRGDVHRLEWVIDEVIFPQ
ncbi:MAG: hypothetical protein GY838_17170 [bacterium]|nr:hypothetical protein [bacterium]